MKNSKEPVIWNCSWTDAWPTSRIFPAIDLVASSTRRDDLLLERDVLQRMNLLRVYLNDMNTEEAMNELLKRMRGTKSNEEFLASMNS